MNIRDAGTVWWLTLDVIKGKLEDLDNCEDQYEMVAIAYELAADIDTLMGDIEVGLDLRMDDE